MRQQDKQEVIMAAAIKRLSHFGVNKTTLSEIADDLGMTKQALHYYFSDKQTLIKAVLDYIANGYLESLRKHLALSTNFEEALIQLVEMRYSYFSKYHMVLCELIDTETPKTSDLVSLKEYLREQEQDMLVSLFNDALKLQEVKAADGKMIVELVQDTIDAFAYSSNSNRLLDQSQFRQIMQRQKQVIRLLYKGIEA